MFWLVCVTAFFSVSLLRVCVEATVRQKSRKCCFPSFPPTTSCEFSVQTQRSLPKAAFEKLELTGRTLTGPVILTMKMLFPRVFVETPSPSCMLFHAFPFWPPRAKFCGSHPLSTGIVIIMLRPLSYSS